MSKVRTFAIAVSGLTDSDIRVFKCICALSAGRSRTYRLLEPHDTLAQADIYMVNAESPAAMATFSSTTSEHKSCVVLLSRTGEQAGKYNLKRPIVPTNVLKVLDELTVVELGFTPEMAHFGEHAEARSGQPENDVNKLLNGMADQKAEARLFRALVVDDSPTVRKQLELGLQLAGGEVISVETGEEALRVVAEQAVDMVFLDVVLPGADGYSVCRAIKKSRHTKDLPVIMLTSRNSPFDKIRGNLAGCDTYLTKPVNNEIFRTTVTKYMPAPISPTQASV